MVIENIIIENQEVLYYSKALNYFTDKQNVLKISENINGENVINFSIVNNYINDLEFKPNVYGLLTRDVNEENWKLRYIGQRKSKDIKQRLCQHLKKKHIKTGAQLNKIKSELVIGKEIGIKLLSIYPDELRQYYEEKLITDLQLDWNIQNNYGG
ncbi:hypothetical protein [Flavobacterium aestivum]|uniref:hypothetical protein n=1 Tax=Flavobacterium aestivum TaxID=3003257 RepID=UPI00228645A2|nr:hypothetical protein [Flavobacterium aestivum]